VRYTLPVVGIGIDFGTSNSSVAIFDGRDLCYVQVDDAAASPEVMPTALYLDRARRPAVGQAAIERYLRDNAGRVVRLRRQEVGLIEITVAGTDQTRGGADGGAISDVHPVHAFADLDMPGRLFRSLKRWLGNASVDGVNVFGSRYRIVALLTPILSHLRSRAGTALGAAPDTIYLGRPVVFAGPTPDANEVAVPRLREACTYAGFGKVSLYPEPTAAVLSFLHDRGREPGQQLLCFDFGGGTLDLCVVRTTRQGFEILSTHGIPLGGDTIDRLLCRGTVFPELGEGCEIPSDNYRGPRTLPFPFERFADSILNWQLAYELNRPELRELIVLGMRLGGECEVKLGRLYELVTRNLSYRVLRAVEHAKVALSENEIATIEVPELDLAVPVAREEFEALLAVPLEQIEGAVRATLERAGTPAERIDAVICTGGSSRIPAVRALLGHLVPGRIVEHGTFTSIAAGLAIASHHGARSPLGAS
jgi:hypothetical chaperone protein